MFKLAARPIAVGVYHHRIRRHFFINPLPLFSSLSFNFIFLGADAFILCQGLLYVESLIPTIYHANGGTNGIARCISWGVATEYILYVFMKNICFERGSLNEWGSVLQPVRQPKRNHRSRSFRHVFSFEYGSNCIHKIKFRMHSPNIILPEQMETISAELFAPEQCSYNKSVELMRPFAVQSA